MSRDANREANPLHAVAHGLSLHANLRAGTASATLNGCRAMLGGQEVPFTIKGEDVDFWVCHRSEILSRRKGSLPRRLCGPYPIQWIRLHNFSEKTRRAAELQHHQQCHLCIVTKGSRRRNFYRSAARRYLDAGASRISN